ncbi:hypothetical protein EW145_g4966 [Phellinidium pouzarii]|uniref:XRRM domain-containing protein n=1 Tax=Phellinidium pouzarii TaxID=167371 RepID=A0A4S4L1P5_9AGAM|nr:hypothetical protein EW145_g4966 [Phellinidium pouzarii]
MSTHEFYFVPRKLAKSREKLTSETKTPIESVSSGSSAELYKTSGPTPATCRGPGKKDADNADDAEVPYRPKQKEKERFLDDSAYMSLLELALSEYALWSDPELLERMDVNGEGFVPLSYVTHRAPVLASLTPMPPESILMRCIKSSLFLEARMIVIEPYRDSWFGGQGSRDVSGSSDQGGFEGEFDVQRDDSHTAMPLIQSITFPPHRDDAPDAPRPIKSKGFAFLVLAQMKIVDHLLQRWPWDLAVRLENNVLKDVEKKGVEAAAAYDAREFGFHCLSKKKWEALKRDYISLQRRLLEKTIAASQPEPSSFSRMPVEETARSPTLNGKYTKAQNKSTITMQKDSVQPLVYQAQNLSFPSGCLVFIKNVHPETNKTTLRTLFTSALDGMADAIDYVDYNKGLDNCYLRLAAPSYARTLVKYFSSREVTQENALDSAGVPQSKRGVSMPIEVELIQGRKEEMYWAKVPENIKKQAIAKAQTHAKPEYEGSAMPGENRCEDRRRHKRQKHG